MEQSMQSNGRQRRRANKLVGSARLSNELGAATNLRFACRTAGRLSPRDFD